MENISTGLKWVIGVIVTILIIAAAVSIYLVINGYFNRAQEQTLSQSQLISQAEFSNYDNKDVSGQDVINAATRYKGRPQFSIQITTGERPTGFYAKNNYETCYGQPIDDASGKYIDVEPSNSQCASNSMVDITKMQDPSKSEYYVNTAATFKSEIFRDRNGEVRKIEFSQKR